MLDNAPNQWTKFKTKNWFEISDEPQGTYNKDNQIRFKASMLGSNLCNYSDPCILVKRTITVENTAFKNFASFTNCISWINNTQLDGASYVDVVMLM